MHMLLFNRSSWHALGTQVGAMVVTVFKSCSRGEVALGDPDPKDAVRVRFNVLSDPGDFERLVTGTRFALDVLADPGVADGHEIFNRRWA